MPRKQQNVINAQGSINQAVWALNLFTPKEMKQANFNSTAEREVYVKTQCIEAVKYLNQYIEK